jgi:post-segregation antitoxin (ccd killing protein)
MTITVSVPDQLAEQAAVRGLSVEALVEQLAEQAAHGEESSQRPKRTPAEAVAHLREARKGVMLGGIKIKDLVAEGRKY